MSEFRGFAPELFTFFEGLAKDNSKSFWNAHRAEWEQYVRDPMRALLEDLAGEFGPLRMFRPNRDMRFSKDALSAASATTSRCPRPASSPASARWPWHVTSSHDSRGLECVTNAEGSEM
jgi:uncharacterized protein (DUF2461 family)